MDFIKNLVAKHVKDRFRPVTAKTSTTSKIKNFTVLYDPKLKKDDEGIKEI